ncbi:MAG TPA: hypothetical protein G4O13_00775 [Dehalococcoidia bacterium]|nr:hypothetical protein [Dehalococcoidia bacterium]
MPDKDDKIKSALDIALERAQRLGAPSEDEKRRLKEEELAAAGEALVKRYLSGLPLRDIDAELARHAEDERETVKRHLLSNLLDRIDVRRGAADEKVLTAIEHLTGDAGTVQAIGKLMKEYNGALEKAQLEKQGALREAKLNELKLKGISGSAVEPAVESSAEWLETQRSLESQYRERLDELKRKCRNQ